MRMCVVENSPAPVVCCRERPREPQQASQGGQQSPADSKGTLTRCSERSRCVRQQLKTRHGPPARCSRSRPDTVLLPGAVEADQTDGNSKPRAARHNYGIWSQLMKALLLSQGSSMEFRLINITRSWGDFSKFCTVLHIRSCVEYIWSFQFNQYEQQCLFVLFPLMCVV